MKTIFPWHQTVWQNIWQRQLNAKLPHALLLTGLAGVGKKHFAQCFLTSLLCDHPSERGEACEVCRHCLLIKAGNHPDVLNIFPENSGQRIKVDEIRKITEFVQATALLNTNRVIVINSAEAMNHQAANALLKTLEEPTPQALFILTVEQTARLPLTIVSRCQRFIFKTPSKEIALTWLKENVPVSKLAGVDLNLLLNLAHHAPLKAKEILEDSLLETRQMLYQTLFALSEKKEDPLNSARLFHEKNPAIILQLLISWLMDILREKVIHHQGMINVDYQSNIKMLSNKILHHQLISYMDYIQKIYKYISNSLNLNNTLLQEDIFIRWAQLCS